MSALPKAVFAPYGWQWSGEGLEPHPSEQQVLRQLRLYSAFGATALEISQELERDGCVSRGGARFRVSDVEELLDYDDELLWREWLLRELGEY